MTHHTPSSHRSSPVLIASTLLAAVGCILLAACSTTSAHKSDDASEAPRQVTLSGTSVCLPHRDTSGFHTMECAYGLKTADGSHYALDLSVPRQNFFMDFPTHEEVTLKGTLVPLKDIDERTWDTYDIVGQLRVTSIHREA